MMVLAAASLVAAFIGVVQTQAQAQGQAPGGLRWVKAAPFPEPEEELYGAVANGKLYVIGGFGYMPFGNPPGLVYEYDPGPDKWTKKKGIPVRVHHQAQTVVNNKIYVFGGCTRGIGGDDAVENAWEYDPTADAWKALAPIPGRRCSAVAETVNGKIPIGGIEPFENGKGTRITAEPDVRPGDEYVDESQFDADRAQSCLCRGGERQDLCHRRPSWRRHDPLQQQRRRRRGI